LAQERQAADDLSSQQAKVSHAVSHREALAATVRPSGMWDGCTVRKSQLVWLLTAYKLNSSARIHQQHTVMCSAKDAAVAMSRAVRSPHSRSTVRCYPGLVVTTLLGRAQGWPWATLGNQQNCSTLGCTGHQGASLCTPPPLAVSPPWPHYHLSTLHVPVLPYAQCSPCAQCSPYNSPYAWCSPSPLFPLCPLFPLPRWLTWRARS